jgi:GTPase SAR1 family protein
MEKGAVFMPDPGEETKGMLAAVAAFVWSNKDWIWTRLTEIRSWFRRGEGTEKSPGILILGTGGAGKSTLARLLSDEDYNPLLSLPGEYKESIGVETYSLNDDSGVEIVVPPGQRQRREATWADLHADLAAGKFHGVILLAAYGHNSFMLSYKHHQLYGNDKERFVEDYCAAQRAEEIAVLRQLSPHMMTSGGKLWLLTLVAKQDLWWPKHGEVEKHYRDEEYTAEIQKVVGQRGARQFRHEIAFVSLVISNFWTGAGEQLRPNAAGYDQKMQVESLRRLFETVDALRQWEAGA